MAADPSQKDVQDQENRIVKLIQEVGDRANLVKGISNPSPFEVK